MSGFRKTPNPLTILGLVAALLYCGAVPADSDLPTKFINQGGIINTRHNLTQRTIGTGSVNMNPFRNDYNAVCVYCHTPHGANSALDAPLWNRTFNGNTYTKYDTLGTSTLTQGVTQPGLNSLTCLSCHDGTLGVDSIINIPGSGNYSGTQQTTQNNAFLDTWTNTSGPDATTHLGLDAVNQANGCLACHSPDAGIVGSGATDFRIFALGTDLTNDHPVGITLPAGSPNFRPTTASKPGLSWFDRDGDNRPDTDEIRFYDTGDGPEVECASCHDPHGVPSVGPASPINATFLRVSNGGSGVCLSCHIK